MVTGLRGFPAVQGGVETHCQQLYPRLVKMGCDVEVLCRTNHMDHYPEDQYEGVNLTHIYAPATSGVEALFHTFLCVLYAAIRRPDLLHIHAIGPSLLAPLARLLGLRVVITHHGFDYDRQKWGRGARWILHLGERMGVLFAHRIIVVARYIAESIRERFGNVAAVIPNGVNRMGLSDSTDLLVKLGLSPGRYIIHVGRMVPEKRQLNLIEAFRRAEPGKDWKLLLVGALKPETPYIEEVRTAAEAPEVVLAGFRNFASLSQLYSHAGLFVLPSTHEGLPISLLEALSFGLPVIVSDIPAHRELALDVQEYVPVDDIGALSSAIQPFLQGDAPLFDEDYRSRQITKVSQEYQWDSVATKTHFLIYPQ